MQFPAFVFNNKFGPGHKTAEKQFEWWKIVVAGLMIIATGLLLAVFILSNQTRKTQLSQDTNSTTQVSLVNSGSTALRILPMAQIYCLIRSCVVTCSFIPAASDPGIVAAVFLDSDYKSQCPDKELVEELIFESCRFPDNALSSGWLAPKDGIKKLSFKRCSLTAINADAFSTEPFEKLSSLVIIDNGINVFQKSLFDALTNLEELVIVNNAIHQADVDLLAGTAKALQIIQINNAIYSENVLINIIGKSPLPRVLLLSLTGNFLGRISADMFTGVPNAQSVYLTNSGISSVEAGAFEPFSGSIKQLFLDDNKISSLPSEIFRSILEMNPNFKLTLAKNDWNCDCNLQWLKNLTSTSLTLIDEPRCAAPEWNAMLNFSEANFCSNETSNDTEVVTKPSTATELSENTYTTMPIDSGNEVTTGDKGLITLLCNENEDTSTIFNRKLLSIREFKYMARFPAFSVAEHEDGFVYVSLPYTTSAYTLIWFNNDVIDTDRDGARCITNVKKPVYLTNLRPGISYTICLVEMFNIQTSPFNCLSLQKQPNYPGRLWLANKDKVTYLSSLIVVLIFVCVVSVIGSYCVVRRNPRLLRGSKRIIIVQHRAADAIVLPEGLRFNSSKDLGTSSIAESSMSRLSSQKNYLTPVSQRRLLARKGSVTSGVSSRSSATSYVSGIEPTSMQLMSWRIGRIKEILSCTDPTELDDVPPPLPPPRNQSIPSLSLNVDERGNSNDQTPNSMLSSANEQQTNSNELNNQQIL